MKGLTRREFLSTTAGVAAGSAMTGHDAFLYGEGRIATNNAEDTRRKQDLPLQSWIFPQPQEIFSSDSNFPLDDRVRIVVPPNASEEDRFLAHSIAHEVNDRFSLRLKVEETSHVDSGSRTILMGSMRNPLVRQLCAQIGLGASQLALGSEGYVLRANKNFVLVAGNDDRGAFYGMQSLRQLIWKEEDQVQVRGVRIRDWPDKPFRGIYLFLPGRNNIQYFKRFVRDYMALYKYNTVILEMNAGMRLDRHPELNTGQVEFARDCNYTCRNYPPGAFRNLIQNASHQDCTDGGFLEKEEIADLARWVRQNQIELIPELASYTHSYYLLTKHRDLAAVPENKWPDIYCGANPEIYPLVFDVFDEYIDVLKPKMIHIGHDELFLTVGVSPTCKDDDIGELFGHDIKKIHDHLASRNVKTALWGDMLLESVSGRGMQHHTTHDGWAFRQPGALTPEQVERWVPKDCLIFNWFWSGKNADLNESTLDKMGFQQIYGNLQPSIQNYEERKKRSTLLGGAPSAWFATNEFGFGKELMSSFLGCSNILWTGQVLDGKDLSARVQSMLPVIRTRLSGILPPSLTETTIVPVDISSKLNSGGNLPALGIDLGGMATGTVHFNRIPFDLKSVNAMQAIVVGMDGKEEIPLPKAVTGIPIGVAPTSLIFLHASARPASNKDSYRLIWDQEDTADLLGWYEIVYEDGFLLTIPIRYGVNILEWNWDQHASENNYCYGADAVALGKSGDNSIVFFAFEWINPRLGKVIQEVHLKGTTGFRGAPIKLSHSYGPIIDSNAVILKAISMVKQRTNTQICWTVPCSVPQES